MKTSRRSTFPALAAAAVALAAVLPQGSVLAQTAVTEPVGFTTLTAAPKQGSIDGLTYISLDMKRASVYRGLIPSGGVTTAGGTTVLTFPAGTFTNQFSGANDSFFLEVKNGPTAGLISNITSTTDSTITLADDITSAITPGTTTILARPHWTFATAFGATNSVGFQGSITATNADAISLIDSTTNTFLNYYYNTTNARWQRGGVNATNTVIPPNAGLLITRKQTTAVSFNLVGDVKLGPTGIAIRGGDSTQNFNLVANPYPLPSVTLANSNLYTGSATTGVVGSVTATQADVLTILDPATGVFNNYYYNTTNSRWQRGGVDASTITIPQGAGVLITRKNGRTPFTWFVPQPAMNL